MSIPGIACAGGSGFCARAPGDILVMGEPGIACVPRLPPWDKRIWFLRVRDILVMGEPGIARARRLPP